MRYNLLGSNILPRNLNFVTTKFIVISLTCVAFLTIITIIVCVSTLGNSQKTSGNNVVTTSTTTTSTTTRKTSTLTTAKTSKFSTSATTTRTSTLSPTIGYCQINPFSLNTPLLVSSGTIDLIYPKPGSNVVQFSQNEAVDFSCPGGSVRIGQTVSASTFVTATCKSNQTFYIDENEAVEWGTVTCSNVKPDVKQLTYLDRDGSDSINVCFNDKNNTVGNIGLTIDKDRFLSLIQVCFNSTSKIALYSHYNINSSISNRGINVPQYAFRQDDLFYRMGKSIPSFYRGNQTTINGILGLQDDSTTYINETISISPGHLAAKEDFVYWPLQMSVFRYVNAAPQWNTIDEGNWDQMEEDVRNYAGQNKIDLQIWSGTYGITSLPNQNGELKNLFLYVNESDSNNSPSFPVPAIFWKLVYNPLDQSGIILVVHNNPYKKMSDMDEKLCDTDVSGDVKWLHWDKNNITKGLSYACNYTDKKFEENVSFMPKLSVKQLLV